MPLGKENPHPFDHRSSGVLFATSPFPHQPWLPLPSPGVSTGLDPHFHASQGARWWEWLWERRVG